MNVRDAWIVYYAGLMAMQEHPGAGTKDHVKKTPKEVASIADQMMDETLMRFESRHFHPVFNRKE